MKIVIAGDSWGCGEWLRGDLRKNVATDIVHGGLAQYLTEDGHTVVNLSQGGASNTFIDSAISKHLESESLRDRENPDKIIVFQTTYTRDYRFRFDEYVSSAFKAFCRVASSPFFLSVSLIFSS